MTWFLSMVLNALVWFGVIAGSVGFVVFAAVMLLLLFLVGWISSDAQE